MEKLGKPSHALVIGDTVYDIASAGKLGIPCIAVISGGIERETLLDAGAAAVYLDTADVLRHLDDVLTLPARR
jgi:phosphoglycolate phosphatase-like HAD superfamily hydrolase